MSVPNAKPIVVLHRGNAYYLPYCLAQARYSNPNSPIYLLGDGSNQHPPAGITHHFIEPYSTEAVQFSRQYVHLSSRPEVYERFCIERWFALLSFMRRHNLETCVHLDSDVLLYGDLSRSDDWAGNDMLQYVHWIPHVLYVKARKRWNSSVSTSPSSTRISTGYRLCVTAIRATSPAANRI